MHSIRPCRDADRQAVHALLRDPSLVFEFGWLLENGELEDPLRHPYGDPGATWIGLAAGPPPEDDREVFAGFSMALRLVSARAEWAMVRLGVREPFRRAGLGSALLDRTLAHLRSTSGPEARVCLGHWEPSATAPRFARRHGFEPDRVFWAMERRGSRPTDLRWPPGIETATFDSSDRSFRDWNDCYNSAFAESDLNLTSTIEACRAIASQAHFDPTGLLLAYRAGQCVGFCRSALRARHAEVDVLGVAPEARRIGLGRALLRWGVGWLEARGAARVGLMVDGTNEGALALYRSEEFQTVRTRHVWSRPLFP